MILASKIKSKLILSAAIFSCLLPLSAAADEDEVGITLYNFTDKPITVRFGPYCSSLVGETGDGANKGIAVPFTGKIEVPQEIIEDPCSEKDCIIDVFTSDNCSGGKENKISNAHIRSDLGIIARTVKNLQPTRYIVEGSGKVGTIRMAS